MTNERKAMIAVVDQFILGAKIDQIRDEKNNAVRQQDYAKASLLRMEELKLMNELPKLEDFEALRKLLEE